MTTTERRSKRKLSDEEIVARVQAKERNTISWYDSKLSRENERVIRYYNQTLPKRQSEGNSSYISSDVYDAVEMMKAQLLETFAAGPGIVQFTPKGPDDVKQALIETAYADHVIYEQNDAWGIFHDVLHDGLTARNGIARVYWDECYANDEEKFEGFPLEAVVNLYSQDDVSDLEADMDPQDDPSAPVTYSGSYTRRINKCRVAIEPVAPEEFFLERTVKRREDGIRGIRTLKTRAELIADGYDRDKVEKVNWDDDRSLTLSPEFQARNDTTQAGSTLGDDAVQDELQRVMLYEAYLELSLYGDGKSALCRVVHAGGVPFEITEVDEDPFVEFCPLRVPHTWYGNNYAARVIQTQNARTVLTRAILDHTAITTNPRWQVVKGSLLNPKEMLDNRLGGLVNVSQPDGISALQYPNLNPFVFETLKLLQDSKEENTGISSLSQGLNKDAVSNQNSQGLISDLVSLSQVRQKVIARNFAQQFLIPLYLKVYRLVCLHEKQERIIQVAGEYVPVNCQEFEQRRTVSLSLHLGYGERDREAAKLVQMAQQLSSPAVSAFVTPQNRYNLLKDAIQKNGFRNYSDYISPPGSVPPPQPDPIEATKAKALADSSQAALITAQASAGKAQASLHHEALRTQNDTARVQLDQQVAASEQHRKDLETANRINIAQRELAAAEALPVTEQKGVYAPHI